jgi:c-di-GMP-binding flagellar brake protein YcgR
MEVGTLLKYMQDLPVVKVVIQTTTTSFLMECKIVSITPSYFEIELFPHQVGFSNVNYADSCVVSCEKGGQVFYIDARIDLIISEKCLRLVTRKVATRSQQRGYFRVDAVIYLKFWLVEKENEGQPNIVHQRISLSGNGLRFTTEKPLYVGQLIPLELCLPDSETEVAQGVGRVVRVDDKGINVQEAALELVELEEDEQDKIISFCLAEQRKQLRMRVHVV